MRHGTLPFDPTESGKAYHSGPRREHRGRPESKQVARGKPGASESQCAPGYGLLTASGDFAVGTLQPRTGSSPRFPAVKRLDSRTRVRRPSIAAGMGSCATPWMTKIIKAASPGESALEVMPTP